MRPNLKRYSIAVLVALLLLTVSPGSAEELNGGYAGAFYQVAIGARPTAMGGAYIAVANDGAGPLYNPAGLSLLDKPLFGTSYRAMRLDRQLGYVTVAFPVRGNSTLGVNWLYAGSGSVEVRDTDGYLEGRDFSQNSHQFAITFAKRFERWIAVGANAVYLIGVMPEFDANTVGFDFGAMLYFDQMVDRDTRESRSVRDIQLGLVVQNISKEFRWNNENYIRRYTTSSSDTRIETDKVPIDIGLGASARFMKRHLLIATQISKNEKQSPVFRIGGEYFATPEAMIRAGFGDKRLTLGAGYLFKIGSHQLSADYAFSTDKADEGSEHIFSFDLMF